MMSNSSHKIFVSYKYKDSNVKNLSDYHNKFGHTTARQYVDYLIDHKVSGNDICTAEKDGESLEKFKDSTTNSHLRAKIKGTSITLILISPNMLEQSKPETDQWIPWEISNSLRKADGKTQNALLSVVLPDKDGSYDYFVKRENVHVSGKLTPVNSLDTNNTFQIIRNNMFNELDPHTYYSDENDQIYKGNHSYMSYVRWDDFLENPDKFLKNALDILENSDKYDVQKVVTK